MGTPVGNHPFPSELGEKQLVLSEVIEMFVADGKMWFSLEGKVFLCSGGRVPACSAGNTQERS